MKRLVNSLKITAGLAILVLGMASGCQTPAPPPPEPLPEGFVNLQVSPKQTTAGSAVTVSWAAIGATNLVLDPGNHTSLSETGQLVYVVTRSTTFVLTVGMDGEKFQLSDRVTVP